MRILNVAIELPYDLTPAGLTSLEGEIKSVLLHSQVKGALTFHEATGELVADHIPEEFPKAVTVNGITKVVANRAEEDEFLHPIDPAKVMQPADVEQGSRAIRPNTPAPFVVPAPAPLPRI